ncbi:transporter [Halobacillus andaensis]|uniref:Transporter n=1 Tax=Halobacillus andaensis TaxID=1176239 RepID=A0A917AZT6_HALAA|nr:AEC family transporter [Halobacillus andaensis]MBP2003753.1 putative permease [Halobacillus andaensis]GGF12946.1 transporter [Halobacillus andaensis]
MWMAGTELIILYGIGLIGFVAKRSGWLPQQTEQVLALLILNLTLPCLILTSMNLSVGLHILLDFFVLFLLSGYALLTAYLLSLGIKKRTKLEESRGVVYQSLMLFGNQGFIGYAVCYALFQEQGVMYAAIFNLLYLLLIWTYGIYLFAGVKHSFRLREVFFNPGILATMFGLLIMITPVQLPEIVNGVLTYLGMPTIPLAMLMIGSILADLKWQEFTQVCKNLHTWVVVVVRLLIIPLGLIPFTFLSIPSTLTAVALLITAAPSAPTVFLYAQKYGGDVSFAAIGVTLTTIVSIVTIPLMYFLHQFVHQYFVTV